MNNTPDVSPPDSSPPTDMTYQSSDLQLSANTMSSWEDETFGAHFGTKLLRELWKDRDNADFTIRCGNKRFKVHKILLRMHSDVLTVACDNRSFKEAVTGVLSLKSQPYNGNIDNLGDGDDPEIVEEMVHFFYHLEMTPKTSTYPNGDWCAWASTRLVYLARAYVLAEKYFIEGMKAQIICQFRSTLKSNLHHPELAEACHIIYKKTVEPSGEHGLKTLVAQCLANKLSKIKDSVLHDTLLQEIPELAFRVVKEGTKIPDALPDCPYCGCHHNGDHFDPQW